MDAVEPMIIELDPAGVAQRLTLTTRIWPLSERRRRGVAEVSSGIDDRGRLTIRLGARLFVAGPVGCRWLDRDITRLQFAAEPGDSISLARRLGRFPWPTPFKINWLGGATPKWKRFVYDRLTWRKHDGATLEMVWRGHLWFYRNSGWVDMYDTRLHRACVRGGAPHGRGAMSAPAPVAMQ